MAVDIERGERILIDWDVLTSYRNKTSDKRLSLQWLENTLSLPLTDKKKGSISNDVREMYKYTSNHIREIDGRDLR